MNLRVFYFALLPHMVSFANTVFAQDKNFMFSVVSANRTWKVMRTYNRRILPSTGVYKCRKQLIAPSLKGVKATGTLPYRHWLVAIQALPLPTIFGRMLIANLPPDVTVGIVNVSVAGCKIELFQKNRYKNDAATARSRMQNMINEYGGDPYGRLLEMAKLAQKSGVIKGILLHQGESNPNDSLWPQKVKSIYDMLMKDHHLPPKSLPAGRRVG